MLVAHSNASVVYSLRHRTTKGTLFLVWYERNEPSQTRYWQSLYTSARGFYEVVDYPSYSKWTGNVTFDTPTRLPKWVRDYIKRIVVREQERA